ncbi:hypothetical protein ABZ990_07280 [Streptomyces sp. NPDC046203]|uniref:hypothetical protein n=1 Tax=Streptomyces sp. NPDC046203 TaxID=3154602 RepID=UPI0033F4E408
MSNGGHSTMYTRVLASATLTLVLLGASAAPAPAALKGPGVFVTNGDRVHISSTPPRTASAHAWWTHVSGPGTKARVTIWLQMKSGSKWHSVAKNAKNLKSGNGGSARRVVARKTCANSKKRQWRTMIDVDLIGVPDSPEKAYTETVTVKCGV